MATQVETTLRGPEAYDLAAQGHGRRWRRTRSGRPRSTSNSGSTTSAIPTARSAAKSTRLLDAGEPFTEGTAEMLAADYLPAAA